MAVSPSNSMASSSTASAASVAMPSKKNEHLAAGLRKLEEFRKKKKSGERKTKEKKDGEKNAVPSPVPLSSSPVESLHENPTTRENFSSQKWSQLRHQPSERDEFAALEQHVEDSSQEKFSLQRALDAARSSGESLAQETSSPIENSNQQLEQYKKKKKAGERKAEEKKDGEKNRKNTVLSENNSLSAANERLLQSKEGFTRALDEVTYPNGTHTMLDSGPHPADFLEDYQPSPVVIKGKNLSVPTVFSHASHETEVVSKLSFQADNLESQLSVSKTDSYLPEKKIDSRMWGPSEPMQFTFLPLSSSMASQNASSKFLRPSSTSASAPASSTSTRVLLPSASLPLSSSMATQSTSSQFIWPSSTSISSLPSSASASTTVPYPSSSSLPGIFSISGPQASVTPSRLTARNKEETMLLLSPLSSSPEESLHEEPTLENFSSKKWSQLQPRPSERDEFAALEQHIEDLTQEKFSLQRALDAARSLAESLAQENSSLTEDFNQQGAVVNQMKADLERQTEEIHAQALVLGNFREERERAHQESNSALERSQILAAEVIALEEKVLKLRSNELKLERDLESLKAENDSCKRQISTIEKDRTNLRSMVEALQEEKKLMQGRIRKGAGAFEQQTASKSGLELHDRKDASTSTDDLGVEASDLGDSQATTSSSSQTQPPCTSPSGEGRKQNLASESRRGTANFIPSLLNTESSIMLAIPMSVPSDQRRTIENINLLITEFANERDSLMEALKAESTEASKLRALNAELLQKLEMQTQRLELAVAQSMAHGGTHFLNSHEQPRDEAEYLDEGDEVVERVLGWIMKLFPGGSSKRRSSKLV